MLEWYVYYGDFNAKKIESYNIFNHGGFILDCKKNYKANGDNREEFIERMRKDLMYWFWSKCEWEVVIVSWPEGRGETKIDVYDQVMLNWKLFSDYVWVHREEFKRTKSRRK